MLGPTVGDKLRLADTALIIEIEQDLTLAVRAATAKRSSSAAARPCATAWASRNASNGPGAG